MDWITFGDQLPSVGSQIRIKFDDGSEFPHNYGIIRSISNIKELGPDDCVIADHIGESWSLCSDKYINSVVKDTYSWRISDG